MSIESKFNQTINNYTKEAFENYYIKELHSFNETREQFNLSQNVLKKVLDYFNIVKTKTQITATNQRNKDLLEKKIDIEYFKNTYLYDNLSQSDIAKKFNLSKQQVRCLIYKYKLNKIKRDKYYSRYTLEEIIDIINHSVDKESILNNLKIKDREKYAKELNISYETINKLIDHYNIKNIAKKLGMQKAKETKIKRYGSSNNIDKIRETNLKKYGCEYSGQREECKKKAQNTRLVRYGSPVYNNRSKFLETMNNKYGDKWKPIVEKTQKTNIKKYGVKYYSMTDDFKKKTAPHIIETVLDKSSYTEEYKKLYLNKEASIDFLKKHNHKFSVYDLAKRFHCDKASIYIWADKYDLSQYIKNESSHYEKEIIEWLQQLGINNIVTHNRKILKNLKELDIYLPDYKIAIEFNGTYWHSLLKIKDKNYHFNKSLECQNLGIRLIHIYEYEWTNEITKNKIKEMLKIALGLAENKIYARKCEIKKISNKEAKFINERVHLQGHRNAQVTYGLFYKNELVQIMSFSKTKYNKNLKTDNSWEIIRGCPSSNNVVVGGVEKLFKHFVNDYKPDCVFSYSDFNKFDGTSYNKIGMKFIGYTGPDMCWILNDGRVVKRNPSKHLEYKNNAVSRIYGAGSKKYEWTISSDNLKGEN